MSNIKMSTKCPKLAVMHNMSIDKKSNNWTIDYRSSICKQNLMIYGLVVGWMGGSIGGVLSNH